MEKNNTALDPLACGAISSGVHPAPVLYLGKNMTSKSTRANIKNLWNGENTFMASDGGPTSVEYCFMLGFIILVRIASIDYLGGATQDLYQDLYDAIS